MGKPTIEYEENNDGHLSTVTIKTSVTIDRGVKLVGDLVTRVWLFDEFKSIVKSVNLPEYLGIWEYFEEKCNLDVSGYNPYTWDKIMELEFEEPVGMDILEQVFGLTEETIVRFWFDLHAARERYDRWMLSRYKEAKKFMERKKTLLKNYELQKKQRVDDINDDVMCSILVAVTMNGIKI